MAGSRSRRPYRNGRTIFKHDDRACGDCRADGWVEATDPQPPVLPEERERVVEASTAYQVVSMLQGVVDRGTGRRIKDQPAIPFRVPPGIRLVRVNAQTGLPARAGERDAIWEAFKPGTENLATGPVLEGFGDTAGTVPAMSIPTTDSGGLY
jgi:membrane carboxypeptidase/penicillin-binding protein